jgi:UPF0755 protein
MRWLGGLLFVALLAAGIAGYMFWARVQTPFKGFSEAEQFVDIPPGAGTASIGRTLVARGIVRDPLTFRAALWVSGDARRLKAGEYRFDAPMSPLDVIAKIARGDVAQMTVTFREGLTIAEMAKIAAANGIGTEAAFVAAARDVSKIDDLDPQARDLEGYLFPETYALPRRAEAEVLVGAMVDRFLKVLTPEMQARAKERGLTVRELVTLASIVEKETGHPAERPEVAAVYVNRLRIGMALQADPTVIYALQKSGRYAGNIRRDDLQTESPYNTYRYPGLPPGPIASPGKAALEAALNPAAGEFLYFVSRNDGTHAFARTLEEHNRNVQEFQVRYFRERRLANRSR